MWHTEIFDPPPPKKKPFLLCSVNAICSALLPLHIINSVSAVPVHSFFLYPASLVVNLLFLLFFFSKFSFSLSSLHFYPKALLSISERIPYYNTRLADLHSFYVDLDPDLNRYSILIIFFRTGSGSMHFTCILANSRNQSRRGLSDIYSKLQELPRNS